MDWEPPRATGQPRAWAARAKTRPIAPVAKPLSGAITCATRPANRALAGSSRKRRVSQVDGGRPTRPKRASVTGSRGSAVSGRDMKSRARVSHLGRKGSTSLRYAPASRGPKEAAVSATDRDSTAALPSGKGCAMGSSACSHSRPYRSRGRARNAGELMPSGWAAEHGSCRKPGRVSSSVRAPRRRCHGPRRRPRRSRDGPAPRRPSARSAPHPPRQHRASTAPRTPSSTRRPLRSGYDGAPTVSGRGCSPADGRRGRAVPYSSPATRRAVAASRAAVNGRALPPVMRNGSPVRVRWAPPASSTSRMPAA